MAETAPPTGYDRRDLLRLAGLIVALLLVVGVVLLAGGGGSQERSTGRVQGILTTVSPQELVLQPRDGSEPITFTVRPEDARQLDLTHLELHAADRLQSIVFFEKVGAERFATRVDDA